MRKHQIEASLQSFKSAIDAEFSGVEIVMFGSSATGKNADDSDIDVLVLLPFEPDTGTEERIFNIAYGIELENNVVFGIIVYSKKFWLSDLARAMPLHWNIDREGARI